MNRAKVLSSAIVYTIGGGLPMLGSLVLLPFYTSAFSTAQFGSLSLLIGLTLLFQNIVSFSLDSYLAVHYHHHPDDTRKQNQLISSVFVLELLLGLGFMAVLSLFGGPLFGAIFDDPLITFWKSGLMCVVTAACTAVIRSYFNLLIVKKSAIRYLIWNLAFAVGGVVLSLWFLFEMPGDVNGPLVGRLLTGILFLVVIYVFELKTPRIFSKELMAGWFGFTWPIVVMTLSAWALTYMNPYILNEIIDADGVGVYTFLLSLMFAIEFAQTGLASPLNARIYEARSILGAHSDEERSIHQVYSMLNLMAIAGAVAVLPILSRFITNKSDYLECLYLVPLFSFGYSWRGIYNMAFTVAMFDKHTRSIMINSVVSSVFQVVLTIAMAIPMGLTGAVLSFSIARMIQAIMMEWRVGAQKLIIVNFWKINGAPAIFSLLLVGVYFLMKYNMGWWAPWALMFVTFAAFAMWYRKDVIGILKKVNSKLLRKQSPM